MADYFATRNAFHRALLGGAKRHSLSHAEWGIAGDCTAPVYHDLHAYPPSPKGEVNVSPGTRSPLHVELWFRCRKCDNCLRHRSRLWTAKAIFECRNAIRTWFGTLTLAPERQYASLATARNRYAKSGDFDALAYHAQFARHCSVIGEEITRYVKRVRTQSKCSVRTLFVAEHHKSGLPHYHCLIHERDIVGTTEEILRGKWEWGFTKWKLIEDPRKAGYVCKYLSKSGASRIRASRQYGHTSLDIAKAFLNPEREANDPPNPSLLETQDANGVRRQEGIGWTRTTDSSHSVTAPA